jgi:hypothetical protein
MRTTVLSGLALAALATAGCSSPATAGDNVIVTNSSILLRMNRVALFAVS